MINQFQILILLPLMFGNFNTKVRNYIMSMDAALFSFSFISIQDWIPNELIDAFDFHQSNEYLDFLGAESGSTIVNNLSLFFILFVWMIIHLVVMPFYFKYRKNDSRFAKTIKSIWYFMTFSIYIRILIESYLFI